MIKTCLNHVTKAMFVGRTQRNPKFETQQPRFSNQTQNGQTKCIDMLEIMQDSIIKHPFTSIFNESTRFG
jgi:hypothetical protein